VWIAEAAGATVMTLCEKVEQPGVDPASIDIGVERNVLTVKAQRAEIASDDGRDWQIAERSHGMLSRQLLLGEPLDTARIEAHYNAGVLTLRIPVTEQAKLRKIAITNGSETKQLAA
jgi:HSP20 family protein